MFLKSTLLFTKILECNFHSAKCHKSSGLKKFKNIPKSASQIHQIDSVLKKGRGKIFIFWQCLIIQPLIIIYNKSEFIFNSAHQKFLMLVVCDSNEVRIHNHLVHERTLNHLASLAKWLSVRSWTKWLWVRIRLLSLKLQISRQIFRAKSPMTFRQL